MVDYISTRLQTRFDKASIAIFIVVSKNDLFIFDSKVHFS